MSYGRGDEADQANLEIENHLQTALAKHKVNTNVMQCKDGDTVVCCECGVVIPEARLEAIPHANLCIDCATLLEN